MLVAMVVEKTRFDERDDGEPPEWAYHGYHLTYTEPGYQLLARFYDDMPDQVSVHALKDPPRRGFDEEIPYGDARLARAAIELLSAVGASRLILEDRGVNATRVEVDLARLRAETAHDSN